MPVTLGSWASVFEPVTTEMLCHEGHGSLVAPFAGEHGWYWLNISEKPVTIKLTFTGYHNEVKNYGLIQ